MMLDLSYRFNLDSLLCPLPYQEVLAPRLKPTGPVRSSRSGSGAGGEFTGWVHLPRDYDREEFARIQAAAPPRSSQTPRPWWSSASAARTWGPGASSSCLRSPNYNLKKKDTPNIYFAGNGLSSDALEEVLDLVAGRGFLRQRDLQVGHHHRARRGLPLLPGALGGEVRPGGRPGSGSTPPPTRPARAPSRPWRTREGWETFVVPDDVGGRYSVLTAVGLLPIAVAGIDIDTP